MRAKVASTYGSPHIIALSRVMTEARPLAFAGISAAVKSPLPMSSARARSTCCGRSLGVDGGAVIEGALKAWKNME